MKLYEPSQRLDLAGYNKTENAIYVKAALTVLLPAGSSLIGRDPVLNSPGSANIDYFNQVNNFASATYIFEQVRLIKVLENVLNDREMVLSGKELTASLNNAVKAKIGRIVVYSVTCKVFNEKSAVGGQVTNTISQTGDVSII